MRIRHLLALGALELISLLPVSAGESWNFASTPDFEIFTTASPEHARRTVEYFEQVREFFARSRSLAPETKLPVTIVLFRDLKEFRPFAPHGSARGFYTGDNSRDYVVMVGATEEDRPVAVHEYMHLLVRRANLKFPLWLNEGVAEFYSTVAPYQGKVAVGAPNQARVNTLRQEPWMPLSRLLQVQTNSPEYNGGQHGGAFYAQSWLLVHMLALSDYYRPNFSKFLGLIDNGGSAPEAFQTLYGKTVGQVEGDLLSYYRSGRLKMELFDTQLRQVEAARNGPADPVMADVHLARILANLRRMSEASARLNALAAAHPNRWEVQEAIGQAAWLAGRQDAARAALRKAIELKPQSWNVYYDYARLAMSDASQWPLVLSALREAVRLNPAHVEARLDLGEQLYRMKQFAECASVYQGFGPVTSEFAGRFHAGQALAFLGLRQYDQARQAAETAVRLARDPRDRQNATRVLNALPQVDEDDAAPAASSDSGPVRSLQGLLKQVDCSGTGAQLTIATPDRTLTLVIADARSVKIRRPADTESALMCGAQAEEVHVAVEYAERPGSTGEVRTLEFLP